MRVLSLAVIAVVEVKITETHYGLADHGKCNYSCCVVEECCVRS